jgi:uncharacterized protein YggU (UPF0235/DUF167 family)
VAVRFSVRLTPRGGQDRIDGVSAAGELRVRVRAIPADGAANAALARLVTTGLGLPRDALTLEHGQRGRTKRLRVEGVTAADVVARWPGLAVVDAPDRPAG